MASLESGTRVDATAVKEVFETSLSDQELNNWINSAHRIVESELSGEDVAEGTLEDLEKYLAAHLASSQDPRVTSESVGDARWTYQRDPTETDYWSVVLTLDPTDRLENTKKQTASIAVPSTKR